MFLEVVNKHAPIKSHRIKRKYQPTWLTPQILDCIKERNNCIVRGKIEQYRLLRNSFSKMIDSVKNETYQMKTEEGKTDPRFVWKLFQQFGTNKKGSSNDNSCEI